MKEKRSPDLAWAVLVVALQAGFAGAQPAGAQPAGAQPAGAQPAGAQPAGAQPARAQSAAGQPELDYQFFKSRVEPIFLKKRTGHARCYVCHAESNNALRLERLPAGKPFWSEEQSRRNFAVVAALAGAGDPGKARLLLHPLAPEAGGDAFHSGGRQFTSKDDPDWKTLARWIEGKTP